MKLIRRIHANAVVAVSLLLAAPELGAQGLLTPPGAPVPTMKTLQQLWDELQILKANDTAQQAQVAAVQSQVMLLQQKNSATALNYATGGSLPWTVSAVDNAGSVGVSTSLAFGSDGQPAVSYYDSSNGDLKFARFNGSTWTLTTVDSAGNVGRDNSLAFGPDGLPAISYRDNTNADLKFARMGVFTPAP